MVAYPRGLDPYLTVPTITPAGAPGHDPDPDTEWRPDLDEEDLRDLQAAQHDPSKVVVKLPRESTRMGYWSTACLIFNRMIGVGIFNSPALVFLNTQSIGLSLVFWSIGAVMALAGAVVYIELGLTIPRWPFGANGEKISTPYSGESLNYFNYMLKRPMFLATCLYGITFIILENSAGTSVSFATNILDAAHAKQTPGAVIGIAIAANTFCCLLHAFSRKWGILLNNAFGIVKVIILLFIVIVGLAWLNRDVANANFENSFSFEHSPKGPYRYAEALIYVLLPYAAFHQTNYVISELREPRKVFPRASVIGILVVAVLYTAINIIYAATVPKELLFQMPSGTDIGSQFMQRTLGHVWNNSSHLATFFSILKAISAFGNIIVVTFTTARVKQEIAKEGILPYSLLFAESHRLSIPRLFGRARAKQKSKSISSEGTPVATLCLHWILTVILIVVPVLAIQSSPGAAYGYLTVAFVYDINLTMFVCISVGLLCLRLTPRVRWAEKSVFKHPWISIGSAVILLVICLFPFICLWVPDPDFPFASRTNGLVPWYAGQVLGVVLLVFAFLYWVVFRLYVAVRSAREGTTLYIKRQPIFKHSSGGLVQVLEIVTLQWVRKVGVTLEDIEERDGGSHFDGGQAAKATSHELLGDVSPSHELSDENSHPSSPGFLGSRTLSELMVSGDNSRYQDRSPSPLSQTMVYRDHKKREQPH